MDGYFTIKLPNAKQTGTVEVTARSRAAYRGYVERFARYFKREMGFDFLQYEANCKEPYYAYLFTDGGRFIPGVFTGACCFYQRPEGWAMAWVWVHPYWRRRGTLTKAWPLFKHLAPFEIEAPVSEAMRGFLGKHNAGKLAVLPG